VGLQEFVEIDSVVKRQCPREEGVQLLCLDAEHLVPELHLPFPGLEILPLSLFLVGSLGPLLCSKFAFKLT